MWEKEKMLVTSIFSFSHNIFYLLWIFFSASAKFELSSAQMLPISANVKFCCMRELYTGERRRGGGGSGARFCGPSRSLIVWLYGVLLTSTPHNILSKPPTACFPTKPLSQQRAAVGEEWILSQWLLLILGKSISRAGDRTSDLLFSRLPTELWGSAPEDQVLTAQVAQW